MLKDELERFMCDSYEDQTKSIINHCSCHDFKSEDAKEKDFKPFAIENREIQNYRAHYESELCWCKVAFNLQGAMQWWAV